MARIARFDTPGLLDYVMIRGIEPRTGGYRLAHEKMAKAMDYQLEASGI